MIDPQPPHDDDITPRHPDHDRRHALIYDAILGFLGFFSVVSFIDAVANVFRPSPALTPAIVTLIVVITTVSVWRWGRNKYR